MDYNFEQLGEDRFQHLCQALIAKEFPGVSLLPIRQPDGGRDAVFFSDPSRQDFIVFQVKFARNPADGAKAREWVLEAARGEANKANKLRERGAVKYIFITNVQGTSHLDSGSIDRLRTELSDLLQLPILCWWRDDISRRLDSSWDIKLRYPGVLTGEDYLRLLSETYASENTARRLRAIRAFMADQYDEDVDVKFRQVELQSKLLDLFVDLPFRVSVTLKSDHQASFIASFLEGVTFRAISKDAVLVESGRPSEDRDRASTEDTADIESSTSTLLLSEAGGETLSTIVVEGAPGQGKSTLAQYLCQVNRIKWLARDRDLIHLPPEHVAAPLRIPFKIDLRDLSVWLSQAETEERATSQDAAPRTLETLIASMVEARSGGVEFSVNDLLEISRIAPFLIVLDGLDEVAEIKQRAEVVNAVTRAIPRLRESCPSIKVIVTSRPAAFANSPGFDRERFPHLQLGDLSRSHIQEYAARWMSIRNFSEVEKSELSAILIEKLREPHIRDLSKNPMQLAILLSLIQTKGAALPDKRTSLYDSYVDLFFSREAAKNPVVRKHVDLLRDIHRFVAWRLHSTAETSRKKASGRILEAELKSMLQSYLEREQHQTTVVNEVFGAMVERVVMIVSRVQGTYEFEVQPLREYFAARFLYDTAPYSPVGRERTGTKPDRFDAIARNPYWLNVTRFFCGCFNKGELLDLADRAKTLIEDSELGKTRHPIGLSAMLLSDWVFSQSQRAVEHLVSALGKPASLKRLTPKSPNYNNEPVVQLPDQCGRLLLVESLFERLASGTDYVGSDIILLIRANSTENEIEKRWLKTFNRFAPSQIDRWLWQGRYLGCLATVDYRILVKHLGTRRLGRRGIRALAGVGRYDAICATISNRGELIKYILEEAPRSSGSRAVSEPIYLLPHLFQLIKGLTYWRYHWVTDEIKPAIKRFKEQFPDHEHRTVDRESFAGKAFLISSSFALLIGEEATDFRTPEWEELVDLFSRFFGDCIASIQVAHGYSQVAVTARGSRPSSLFDKSVPLRVRLRQARAKRLDPLWWRAQLGNVSTDFHRFLFQFSFWSHAPSKTILAMAEDIEPALDQLSQSHWLRLMEDLPYAFAVATYSKDGSINHSLREMPFKPTTLRASLLLALCLQDIYARPMFDHVRKMDWKSDRPANQFMQQQSWLAFVEGRLGVVETLRIIRDTYAATGSSAYFNLTTSRSGTLATHLPSNAVESILQDSDLYPPTLWEIAVEAAAIAVRKKIVPVSKIAASEGWFGF